MNLQKNGIDLLMVLAVSIYLRGIGL